MAWYSGLIYAAVRRYSSKNSSIRVPIPELISNFSNKSRVSNFSLPIFSLKNRLKSNTSPFLNGAKRFYSESKNQGSHPTKWLWTKRGVYVGLSLYVLMTAYPEVLTRNEEYLETVPFTNRVHYMLFPPESEKRIGKEYGMEMKILYKDKLLPPDHPQNIRVQRIARNIIEASQGVFEMYEEIESARLSHKTSSLETLELISCSSFQHSVQDRREVGQAKQKMSICRHLEGVEWEFLVVDDPKVCARCLAGGTVVIYTGLLKNCTSDAEVAFLVARQVAHVVARHGLEKLSKFTWWPYTMKQLLRYFTVDTVNEIRRFLEFPLKVRLVIEADRIGVLLMAFAGYDPQMAVQVTKSKLWGSFSLHAMLLRYSKFMSKATHIYREAVGKSSVQPATPAPVDKWIELFRK